ncbi:bifunctional biotin--[acetyl-CoA-carboxylase] ligase/biotin operon repressor BirA [Stenotrophobium rhamnosiphilum]|uniref:Bifunctional ligase/repressor BirA n=1 Tax=Stenotrophobium rhamnosiphilum TaxID=2029166 RepID=A0A2T5MB37_9GAMM|nr:bifunctional biotin--[acetyl-CoA-carboxylase] ligase/biotin operon repressor BirA [Stenotrophobium rhamnosiphilum]PTU28230.1 biotin--[acetyl-CoA-carboxylase] ligase [Stenotrophobium rhamnosiphilum]
MAVTLSEAELLNLVDALADGEWHSGEDLAAVAGITRAALSKRMEKLRDWQLDIETRTGLGYKLTAPLQRLDVAALQAAVPGVQVRVAAVTDSTNAQLLASDAEADPQVLFAEFQTAGRGRRGREWVSPFGANLYLSLAWSFPQWPPQLTALPLAVGVACARALHEVGLDAVKLKWPNDLHVDGRKLGGILIEHRAEAGGPCRVIIGIGLNVAMTGAQAQTVSQPWIGLHEALTAHGKPLVSRRDFAAALSRQLAQALKTFEQTGFNNFAADWSALDLTRDREVTVQGQQGSYNAIARGVDEQGALVVEALGQLQTIHSGEVSLRLA